MEHITRNNDGYKTFCGEDTVLSESVGFAHIVARPYSSEATLLSSDYCPSCVAEYQSWIQSENFMTLSRIFGTSLASAKTHCVSEDTNTFLCGGSLADGGIWKDFTSFKFFIMEGNADRLDLLKRACSDCLSVFETGALPPKKEEPPENFDGKCLHYSLDPDSPEPLCGIETSSSNVYVSDKVQYLELVSDPNVTVCSDCQNSFDIVFLGKSPFPPSRPSGVFLQESVKSEGPLTKVHYLPCGSDDTVLCGDSKDSVRAWTESPDGFGTWGGSPFNDGDPYVLCSRCCAFARDLYIDLDDVASGVPLPQELWDSNPIILDRR